jgi:Ser/Thr protein kinase RdoA (MazF antagonist)
MRTIYSTVLAEDIGVTVQKNYALDKILTCYLLRRGFNDVYAIECMDGDKYVARLSSRRARGLPNVVYETELLSHLANAGVSVALPVEANNGNRYIQLQVGDAERTLVVFKHLDGEPPGDALADIEVMGKGLAQIHNAATNFKGSKSLYSIEISHLLTKPLERILAIPTLDQKLRQDFADVGEYLENLSNGLKNLTLVDCHGDCHGGNTFINDGENGERIASFFDFDDAGPGFLAYDLAVFLWQSLLTKALSTLDETSQNKWTHFVRGYRQNALIPEADFKAIAYFVALRHIWFIGEYAGRLPEWGTQAIPNPWLRKQVTLIREWASMATPQA